MRNRLRENIRCGGSPDHDGRYGLSVGPPDHRPSLPSQPAQEAQPHLYLRARLCRLARPAGLADPKPRWFQYDMEIFRVGQSDAGGLHPVDPHGLSRAGEEGIRPHPRPRLVYDRCLCHLPHGEQYCFRLASCRGLCHWRRSGTGYCSVFHGVDEEDACWGQGVMRPMVHRVAFRC